METGNTEFNLDSLEWPTLEERRLQTKLTLFQKARLKLIDIPTDHLTFKVDRQDGVVTARHINVSIRTLMVTSTLFSLTPQICGTNCH